MSTIKLTTLTPVHVGSGNLLQNNTDFITFTQDKDKFIGVIDEKRMLHLIGEEHINDWILSIERKENTKELVKRYAPHSKLGDYIKRTAWLYHHDITRNDTLKECIHDGMGKPYIPGSSLKGAIRTAITATLANQLSNIKSNNTKSLASEVEKKLFGSNPNNDIFRFIKVGDAYFEEQTEVALRLIMALNVTNKDSLKPNQNDCKPQLVEAIGPEEESIFAMKIDLDYYNFVKKSEASIGVIPTEIQTLTELFNLINNHTIKLLEEEFKIWQKESNNHNGANDYLDNIKEIWQECNACKQGECVLRLGHSSGWRFITGAWGEQLSAFKYDIPNVARPNNEKRYSEYMFPKSRRTGEENELVGFVKLTIM